jgi:pectate lyase
MRIAKTILITAGAAALIAATCSPASAAGVSSPAKGGFTPAHQDLGRQTLPANDGWASANGGTTGGSAASADRVFQVQDRNQLAAALAAPSSAPRIIYIAGIIDANVDDANKALTCQDYAAGTGYTLDAYMAAFDTSTWTWTDRAPAMDAARKAAAAKQKARVDLRVPSNTTIVGADENATLLGANLDIDGVDNVIVRNLTLRNAFDCFPEWSPEDNNPAPATPGNWNSQYDLISVKAATHVWIDHNTMTDLPHPDSESPTYFNRPFQQHDGASDITNGADLVTVSWNKYDDHDKTMLVGSTNSPKYDVGKLNVTIHHNEFTSILERAPRVRWGHADIYNNYYVIPAGQGYQYSWGVGVESHIWAQNNFFALEEGVDAAGILYNWGGTAVHTEGNVVNRSAVDIREAFNQANPAAVLTDDTSWTPTLRNHVDPAQAVPALVGKHAGAGQL